MSASPPVVILVGQPPHQLAGYLLAAYLHEQEIPVQLVQSVAPSAASAPLNPELALLDSDDDLPPLFTHSLAVWRQLAAPFAPVLENLPVVHDLAFSAGRQEKLQNEALLDAIAGEAVVYTPGAPAWCSPTVLGVKSWPNAPVFAATLPARLVAEVTSVVPPLTAAISRLSLSNPHQPELQFTNGTSLAASHVVCTCPVVARQLIPQLGLSLPLRPARGHCFTVQLAAPQSLPAFIVRLPQGHLMAYPQSESQVTLYYDAMNDPAQATAKTEPTPNLGAALAQQVAQLVPALQGASISSTSTFTHWLTPDFLPAFGPWAGLEKIIFAVGWGARAQVFAAGAAQRLADHLALPAGQSAHLFPPAFLPNRFANGTWQPVRAPGSLNFTEPTTPAAPVSAVPPPAEYANTVQLVGGAPQAQYAGQIQAVGKTITAAEKKLPQMVAPRGKGKVQMASIKTK